MLGRRDGTIPPEPASLGRLFLSEGTSYTGDKRPFPCSLHILLIFVVDRSVLFNLRLIKILENHEAKVSSTKQAHPHVSPRVSSVHTPW